MNKNIEIIKSTRLYVLDLISSLTPEELNTVPAGFNNNIIWNLGHMVAAQQGVCYLRAGLQTKIDEAFYLRYKPETKPQGVVDAEGIEQIKGLLLTTLDSFAADYEAHAFENYAAWKTRYGVPLANIDEAVQFLLFHEGLHVGYIMALKRLVKTNL